MVSEYLDFLLVPMVTLSFPLFNSVSLIFLKKVLENLSELFFIVMLLQVATLCTSISELHSVTKFFCGLFIFSYFFLFLAQELYPSLHPTELTYKYDCLPGALLVFVRVLIGIYFESICLVQGISNIDRRRFLIFILLVYSTWFLALPLTVSIVGNFPFYYRWKYALGIGELVNLFGFVCFLLIATPNYVSKRFAAVPFYANPFSALSSESGLLGDQNENDQL